MKQKNIGTFRDISTQEHTVWTTKAKLPYRARVVTFTEAAQYLLFSSIKTHYQAKFGEVRLDCTGTLISDYFKSDEVSS